MPVVPLENLIVAATEEELLDTALEVADGLGLDVDSWRAGDPTRSLYHVEAKLNATREDIRVLYARSVGLDYIAELAKTGDEGAKLWLRVLAFQFFGVDVPTATYATTDVVLSNPDSQFFELEAGDLTLKDSSTGKTFHSIAFPDFPGSTTAILNSGPGTTLTVTVEADEPGSESSAGAGDIDELVTPLGNVTCTNPTAAVGQDEQDVETTVSQCRDKQGSFSPAGPKDAYNFVAKEPALTGTTAVTRSRVYGDGDTGDVLLIVAGPSGPVAGPDVALVEAAVVKWALAICDTPTVQSAAGVTIPVTYTLWIYKSVNKTEAEVKAAILKALQSLFRVRPIGGDIIPPATTGAFYASKVESTIGEVFKDQTFRLSVATPASDTPIANDEVAVLGTVTATITFVNDP